VSERRRICVSVIVVASQDHYLGRCTVRLVPISLLRPVCLSSTCLSVTCLSATCPSITCPSITCLSITFLSRAKLIRWPLAYLGSAAPWLFRPHASVDVRSVDKTGALEAGDEFLQYVLLGLGASRPRRHLQAVPPGEVFNEHVAIGW
jgi:hypothetical protein